MKNIVFLNDVVTSTPVVSQTDPLIVLEESLIQDSSCVYDEENSLPATVIVIPDTNNESLIHNDLEAIQGGRTGERYHITQTQHDAVINADRPSATNPFITDKALVNKLRTNRFESVIIVNAQDVAQIEITSNDGCYIVKDKNGDTLMQICSDSTVDPDPDPNPTLLDNYIEEGYYEPEGYAIEGPPITNAGNAITDNENNPITNNNQSAITTNNTTLIIDK